MIRLYQAKFAKKSSQAIVGLSYLACKIYYYNYVKLYFLKMCPNHRTEHKKEPIATSFTFSLKENKIIKCCTYLLRARNVPTNYVNKKFN